MDQRMKISQGLGDHLTYMVGGRLINKQIPGHVANLARNLRWGQAGRPDWRQARQLTWNQAGHPDCCQAKQQNQCSLAK